MRLVAVLSGKWTFTKTDDVNSGPAVRYTWHGPVPEQAWSRDIDRIIREFHRTVEAKGIHDPSALGPYMVIHVPAKKNASTIEVANTRVMESQKPHFFIAARNRILQESEEFFEVS